MNCRSSTRTLRIQYLSKRVPRRWARTRNYFVPFGPYPSFPLFLPRKILRQFEETMASAGVDAPLTSFSDLYVCLATTKGISQLHFIPSIVQRRANICYPRSFPGSLASEQLRG